MWWLWWRVGALVGVLIVVIVSLTWWYQVHHCHGNGHYYWSTSCVPTGKTVVCYPLRQEEIVCDK